MPWDNVDKFLGDVCKHVKYKGAHIAIREELENHIEDKIRDYVDSGMEEDESLRKAIEAMGDPTEIGTNLNKLHRPYLGWILSFTNFLIIVGLFLMVTLVIPHLAIYFKSLDPMPDKKNIKYSIKVNEKAKIDDRIIVVKEVVVDNYNRLYIRYNDYGNPFYRVWDFMGFKVSDDKGNTYFKGGGQAREGMFMAKYLKIFDDFDETATRIFLEYDYYNRNMKFEIPIGGGGSI